MARRQPRRSRIVEVRPAPDDGRVRRVHVTEASRAYWAARDEADTAYLQSLFQGLARVHADVQRHYDAVRHPERGATASAAGSVPE